MHLRDPADAPGASLRSIRSADLHHRARLRDPADAPGLSHPAHLRRLIHLIGRRRPAHPRSPRYVRMPTPRQTFYYKKGWMPTDKRKK